MGVMLFLGGLLAVLVALVGLIKGNLLSLRIHSRRGALVMLLASFLVMFTGILTADADKSVEELEEMRDPPVYIDTEVEAITSHFLALGFQFEERTEGGHVISYGDHRNYDFTLYVAAEKPRQSVLHRILFGKTDPRVNEMSLDWFVTDEITRDEAEKFVLIAKDIINLTVEEENAEDALEWMGLTLEEGMLSFGEPEGDFMEFAASESINGLTLHVMMDEHFEAQQALVELVVESNGYLMSR